MTTQTIEPPRSAATRTPTKTNWEMWSWIFMRGSGIVLIVLIFGHLFINMVAGQGIKQIDFAFIAGKWSTPFWQIWDTAMLALAMFHGSNGMRTIVNDYVARPAARRSLLIAIAAVCIALVVLGTLVCWTFNPCPAGATGADLPSFCPAQ